MYVSVPSKTDNIFELSSPLNKHHHHPQQGYRNHEHLRTNINKNRHNIYIKTYEPPTHVL